jgi:hypothetical protein
MLSLRKSLDDPSVFRGLFPSPSWDAWRVVASVLQGKRLTAAERAIFTQCTGREREPTRPLRELWVVAGRKSGKSRFAGLVSAYLAAAADPRCLAAGETALVLLCAPAKYQNVVLGYVKALFKTVPLLRPLVARETPESLELTTGVTIAVQTSNFRTVRGPSLVAAVVDEIAFLRDEQSATPDKELIRAVAPAMITTKGVLIGISSPWAAKGVLYEKHHKHYGHDDPRVLVWQASSLVMHPALDREEIAAASEDDPEGAKAEWEGCFRSDLESYVSMDVLDACTSPGVLERPRLLDVSYTAFLDVAAGSGRDSFAVAVAHLEPRDGEAPVVVLDAVREIRPPFDPISVTGEVALFLRRFYGVTVVQSDRYAGAWVVEAFQRHGVQVVQDAEPKSTLYLDALPVLNGRRCDLLDLPKLRAQFASLERRRRAGGRDVVDHPPGSHDDVANCVAGVLASAGAGDGDFVLAANVAPADRQPLLDRAELEAMRRLVDGGGW